MKTGILVAIIFLSPVLMYRSGIGAKNFSFFVGSGYSIPGMPSVFSDYWHPGVNFGGGIGYLIFPALGIRAYFDYSQFSLHKDKYKRDFMAGYTGEVDGGSVTIIAGSIGIRASPVMGIPFRPYFTGEAGGFRKIWDDITYVWGGEQKVFDKGNYESVPSVLAFGIGVDFSLETLDFYVEEGYRIGFTVINGWTGYFLIKIGLKVNF